MHEYDHLHAHSNVLTDCTHHKAFSMANSKVQGTKLYTASQQVRSNPGYSYQVTEPDCCCSQHN